MASESLNLLKGTVCSSVLFRASNPLSRTAVGSTSSVAGRRPSTECGLVSARHVSSHLRPSARFFPRFKFRPPASESGVPLLQLSRREGLAWQNLALGSVCSRPRLGERGMKLEEKTRHPGHPSGPPWGLLKSSVA